MSIFSHFIVLGILVFMLVSLTWGIARYYNNPSIIDVFWPIGLWLGGTVHLYENITKFIPCLFFCLLSVWAARLAAYLLITRIIKGIVDKRYLDLHQASRQAWLSYFLNFQLQGLFILCISSPFIFIATIQHLSALVYVAMLCIFTGIIGEFFADQQLQAFKRKYPGKVCNAGLWQYSRHPNYFFDWLTWVGFALAALSQPNGWLAFISPLLLLLIMTKITGPLTEKLSVKAKGDAYKQYQKTTSMFLLWKKVK